MKRTKYPTKQSKKEKKQRRQRNLLGIEHSYFGTELWRVCDWNDAGRPKTFNSPNEMMVACNNYFQWVAENSLMEEKTVGQYMGEVLTHKTPRMRAMTIRGLCVFIGITTTGWAEYRKRPEFSLVVQKVETIIYEQKFTGAAAGLLRTDIIAKELGLIDRQDITSGDRAINGTSVEVTIDMNVKEAEMVYKQMLKEEQN